MKLRKRILRGTLALLCTNVLLTAGTVMGMGCSDGSGNGGYQYDDNQMGNNNGNQQGGNNGGNIGNENIGGVPGKTYAEPYHIPYGNGNYIIHNFMGNDVSGQIGGSIDQDTAVEDVNYYLAQAETYVKGLATEFKNSLNGRSTTTKNYFKDYIETLLNNNHYSIDDKRMDLAYSTNSNASNYIFQDIINNLSSKDERMAFIMCYNVLQAQEYYEGYGFQRDAYKNDYNGGYKYYMTIPNGTWQYNSTLNYIPLDDDIEKGCPNITTKLDSLLETARLNMNEKYNNPDIYAADLRYVLNITLTTQALQAMHDYTKTIASLQHDNCAHVSLNDTIFEPVLTQPAITMQQIQGIEMAR